jgi:hypothetical protein
MYFYFHISATTPLPSIALKVGDPPIRVGGWCKGEGVIITEIIYNYNQSLSLPALSHEHIRVLETWCGIYFLISFLFFCISITPLLVYYKENHQELNAQLEAEAQKREKEGENYVKDEELANSEKNIYKLEVFLPFLYVICFFIVVSSSIISFALF